MLYRKPAILVNLLLLICSFTISCKQQRKDDEIEAGKKLAHQNCVSCHSFPAPGLIDKTTWANNVLPAMGAKLGIEQVSGLDRAKINSAVTVEQWKQIVAYYNQLAPKKLIIPRQNPAPVTDWSIFTLKTPVNAGSLLPLTSMLAFNPYDKELYSADGGNNIYKWDQNLNFKKVTEAPSPATYAIFNKDKSIIFNCIGSLAPVNIPVGKLVAYTGTKKPLFTIADSLPRPVQTLQADFNKDGLTDYLVCGFGHDAGGLYMLKQSPGHQFKKQVIRDVAGAESAAIGDFNHDGWPDIICLFAQADEGIWMFLNDKKGGFTTINLLRFPPIYGSTSIQLVDFNHDGYPDILYTAGDNADYSPVLKPYHGVYIFMNDGHYNFKQKFFYHINGCIKATAADFRKNGKYDIAAISFFPDFKGHPTEGMVFLENQSGVNYVPHEIPVNQYGQWLTMDVDDFNGDGYLDIALGNFSLGNNKKKAAPHFPLIVLQNTLSNKK
jgi:hypothetical protein